MSLPYGGEPGARYDTEIRLEASRNLVMGDLDRARLYVSILSACAEAGRRILVIVGNASSAGDVKPLLPPDGHTPVLITSRHSLTGIGACLHDLTALDAPAAP